MVGIPHCGLVPQLLRKAGGAGSRQAEFCRKPDYNAAAVPAMPSNNNKETLNKSFDKLRTNGKLLIPFVVMLSSVEASNHEWNQLVQSFLKTRRLATPTTET